MKTYQKYFIILGIMTCLLSSLSFVEAQNDPKAEEKRKAEEKKKELEKKNE